MNSHYITQRLSSFYESIIALGIIWLLIIILINPIGDFPLNDDWAYALAVKGIVENGTYSPGSWPSMTLIVHVLYGGIWSSIFGFSHSILRLSTLAVSYLGIIWLYRLLKLSMKNNILMYCLLGCYMLNPLTILLSYSFMTDIPFLSLTIGSVFYYVRYNRTNHVKYLAIATLISVGSVLIRQLGLIVPAAFLIASIPLSHSLKEKLITVTPLVITTLAMVLFLSWIGNNEDSNVRSGIDVLNNLRPDYLLSVIRRIGIIFLYLGIFLLPLSILYLRSFYKLVVVNFSHFLLVLTALAYPIYLGILRLPLGNVISGYGLGPKILRDSQYGLNVSAANDVLSMLAIIGSVIGAIFLIMVLCGSFVKMRKDSFSSRLSVACIGIYTIYLILDDFFFDRYLLFLLPFAILFIAPILDRLKNKSRAFILPFILIAATGYYSAAGTHEYLSWNRARWIASNYLTDYLNINPKDIDGGFEFNGWYQTSTRNHDNGKSWWFVYDDVYSVSFGPIEGYSTIKTFPYYVLPGFHDGVILIGKRDR